MEIRIVSRDERTLVLEIDGEDHTLGNMLMKQALKHPDVEYSAYRIPHPLKSTIEFTIVVKKGADIGRVLRDVIDQLKHEIEEFKRHVEEVLVEE